MAAVASSEVGEVVEGTCYCAREARSAIRQAGTGSLRKSSQMVHQTWEWASPRMEQILTGLTKGEVPVCHPARVRGQGGDP